MDTPGFSIITVVKDDAGGFAATRSSLLSQAFCDFEWLVKDGGSAAPTLAEIEFARAAGEIRWLGTGIDDGPFDAMNRCLDQARGRYILFLNAGDRLEGPGVLATIARTAEREGYPDLIIGACREAGPDGRFHVKRPRALSAIWYGLPSHHCAIFYHRRTLSHHRFDMRHSIAADYALTLELAMSGARAALTDTVVSIFAPGGLSQRSARVGRRQQDDIRRQAFGRSAPQRLAALAAHELAQWMRSCAPVFYCLLRYDRRFRSLRDR